MLGGRRLDAGVGRELQALVLDADRLVLLGLVGVGVFVHVCM